MSEAILYTDSPTMDVRLKIWRFDSTTGDRELKEYEVEAPDWATLLDVLDIIKDRVDGSLAYRKSCRMMICGSCGMRMDGGAVHPHATRAADHHATALAVRERAVVAVLDDVEHVEQRHPLGRLDLVLA